MPPSPRLPLDSLGFRDLSFGAIRRWRMVLVGCVGLVGLGALAWVSIPRLEEPAIDVPGLSIYLQHPGASPEDIELQVVKPVEEALGELPDLEGSSLAPCRAWPSSTCGSPRAWTWT